MKAAEFVTNTTSKFIVNPFPNSKVQEVMYHGTPAKFDTFNRASHGIYVTPVRSWAEEHYGSNIIPLWVNVTKIYKPTEDEVDLFYDREYARIAVLLNSLAMQGYDYLRFGGESDAAVLFNNVKIVNAISGKPM